LFVDILVDVGIRDFISSSGCMGIPNQPPFIANVTSVISRNLTENGHYGKSAVFEQCLQKNSAVKTTTRLPPLANARYAASKAASYWLRHGYTLGARWFCILVRPFMAAILRGYAKVKHIYRAAILELLNCHYLLNFCMFSCSLRICRTGSEWCKWKSIF